MINQYVYDCLKKASKSNFKTVAFPALGTGKLGYDNSIVAEAMLGSVERFSRQYPSSSVAVVNIVILQANTEVLNVFEVHLNTDIGNFTVNII